MLPLYTHYIHGTYTPELMVLSVTRCNDCNFLSMAEREGFEPSVPRKRDNGFRDRPVRPLRHLSD
jgi:hypothetical protein